MRLIDTDELKEYKFVGVQTDDIDEIPIKAYQQGWNDAIDAIVDNAPTVERPQGEWIEFKGGYYKCDKCRAVERAKMNFCSRCGADMRGDRE